MEQVVFQCEIITPMFLYGADGKTPELRAPSIKGALRVWWRAANGHLSIEELRRKEAEIFGDAGEYGKSKVVMRVYSINMKHRDYRPVPHKNFEKKAFDVQGIFSIDFLMQKNFKLQGLEKKIDLNYIKSLFILLSFLGGIGGRSRRGFGSFKINRLDNEQFCYDKYFNLDDIINLLNNINIDKKKHFYKNEKTIFSDFSSEKFPYIKEIKIGNKANNLLKKISLASHTHNSDYTGFSKGKQRLASPIYVSVIQSIHNNELMPVVTTLETVFINKLKTKHNDKSKNFIEEVLL